MSETKTFFFSFLLLGGETFQHVEDQVVCYTSCTHTHTHENLA